MSKAYELISASLNEIISDLEENDGQNLRRDVVGTEKFAPKAVSLQNESFNQKFLEEQSRELGDVAS